jgi:hypothetical protein
LDPKTQTDVGRYSSKFKAHIKDSAKTIMPKVKEQRGHRNEQERSQKQMKIGALICSIVNLLLESLCKNNKISEKKASKKKIISSFKRSNTSINDLFFLIFSFHTILKASGKFKI